MMGSEKHLPLVVAFLACVGHVGGRFVLEKNANALTVTSPDSLKGTYESSIGNFGIPQYGGTMRGLVKYPSKSSTACANFSTFDISFKPESAGGLPTVALVDRGNCFFAMKVYHAQVAGAAAVLVADDRLEPLITMDYPEEDPSDDVRALDFVNNITIPSALITKEFSDSLKKAIKSGEMVTINFDWREFLPHPDDRVEYEFWTNSNDECGSKCDAQMDFIRNFKGVAQILEKGGYTEFTPHYITWYGPPPFIYSKQCESQCIRHGRYCTSDPEQDFSVGYNGKDVVLENLRQLCVLKEAKDNKRTWAWWDYVTDFQQAMRISVLARISAVSISVSSLRVVADFPRWLLSIVEIVSSR